MGNRRRTTTEVCLGTDAWVDMLEGRAHPDLRARIVRHAARCESCRMVLSSLACGDTPESPPAVSEDRSSRALAPGTQIGRYVIMDQIGAGGMGVVHAARDPELGRIVAIKLLRGDSDLDMQRRLRREAQIMAQLAHPHVVAVYDVGAFDGRTFIAMEYVAGDTLARWLATPRSQREILEAYCAAGHGLAAAHAAGIVHRDLKPENVLVGNDGRVRVGDFGLARGIDTGRAEQAASGAVFGEGSNPEPDNVPGTVSKLTVPGVLLGTPLYMAPELYEGKEADARSDQFSFCVALFTALYGERPFHGVTVDALVANVRAGRVHTPDRVSRVPRRIRRAIQRGLSIDPAARFASLDALLAELSPRRPRWMHWAIGSGAAAAIIVGLIARPPADVPDQRCTGGAAAFATAWNPARRGELVAAFTSTHVPYAGTTLHQVTSTLDRYAARWTWSHADACRATRILGEQTEAALELRMACLERIRREADALVSASIARPREAVTRAAIAVAGLTEVSACADVATLRKIGAQPVDPSTRARIAALTSRLADARASYWIGAFPHALALARSIAAEARILAYRPFQAEAELLQAQIETAMGDMKQAEISLEAAVWSAEAGSHDQVAAQAWVRLMFMIGYNRADYARGLAIAPRVTAALARLGGNPDVESFLERALGAIAVAQNNYDEAIAHLQRAVSLAERAFGRDHPYVATAMVSLGNAVLTQGRADQAVPILQQAYEIQKRVLGPDHPRTAEALSGLATAHSDAGHPALAEQELRRALAIRQAALPPRHGDLAHNFNFLAMVLDDQGEPDEAVVAARRAVAIGEDAFGRDHPIYGSMLVQLGRYLGHVGRYPEAYEQLRRGEAIIARVNGPDDVEAMLARAERGGLLVRQARWREALAVYDRISSVLETSVIIRKDIARAIVGRAIALIELHQARRGLPALEKLASKLDEVRPDLRGEIEFTLARALWDSGGRARARLLADHARAGLEAAGGAHRDELSRIERWLARHRV